MSNPLDPIHDDDRVVLEFIVTQTDGSAQPITGATIEATAKDASRGTLATLASSISDGAGGVFIVDITPGDLTEGVWIVQAKITLTTGETQTPLDRSIHVKPSH